MELNDQILKISEHLQFLPIKRNQMKSQDQESIFMNVSSTDMPKHILYTSSYKQIENKTAQNRSNVANAREKELRLERKNHEFEWVNISKKIM